MIVSCAVKWAYTAETLLLCLFFCVILGIITRFFLYMENEESDKKNTWYNVGMIWELIM